MEVKHPAFEQQFTPKELGELWKLSHDTITRWFQDEPGVLKICTLKRKRVTLRIPKSVVVRVYERYAR